jgi:Fe-S cluster assembly iron-binding protein IscA
MINLKNTKLDYVELEGNDKQFIFINPNDPEHKKPDETLDSNTTHEFN